MSSSETFVENGKYSLAIKLLEAGYDVWLGNNRGNIYSRKHIYLDPSRDANQFFDFSFYEMGAIDLPAMIDSVLEVTGFPTLTYIAHSQGTAQMFSALAENKDDLRHKINLFVAMAPVVRLDHSRHPYLNRLSEWVDKAQFSLAWFGIHEVYGPEWQLQSAFCKYMVDYFEDFCKGPPSFLASRTIRWGSGQVPFDDQVL